MLFVTEDDQAILRLLWAGRERRDDGWYALDNAKRGRRRWSACWPPADSLPYSMAPAIANWRSAG
jgi:hypothetical protein